jgi:hypothetical protein
LSVEEFRIYNGSLTPQQIALDAASGPTQIITNLGTLLSLQMTLTPMVAGATEQPVVTGNFSNVRGLNLSTYGQPTFTSTNSNVVSISSAGLISAVGPGSATIVGTYGGLSVTNSLTVTGFEPGLFIFDSFSDSFWTLVNQGNSNAFVAGAVSATQQPYTIGATAQEFQILYNLQNSTFRLRQRSTGECIGAQGNPIVPGAAVPLSSSYTSASAQQWYLMAAGGGYYRIFNAASNLVLQTDNGNPANVTLALSAVNPFQLWQINYQTNFPKKGTAGYDNPPYSTEMETQWAYNYNDTPTGNDGASFDYVPMIYDAPDWENLSSAQGLDSEWLASSQPAYLMAYNEPDNASQSDTTNTVVIAQWPQIEALNLPLVGPGCKRRLKTVAGGGPIVWHPWATKQL